MQTIEILNNLYDDRLLHVPQRIERIDGRKLTSLSFYRDYVAKPVSQLSIRQSVNFQLTKFGA